MKALPKRKGNGAFARHPALITADASMKALPKRKGNLGSIGLWKQGIPASMKALPKRKGNSYRQEA